MLKKFPQLPLSFEEEQPTFDNYIAGSNVELVTTLKRLAQDDGWRVVYVYGEPGSGKSHLLQACCHEAVSAVYLPLRDPDLNSPHIFEGLENCSLVCIDDVDVMAGKPDWEENLFHLFNRMKESGARLLVSARDVPATIGIVLPDLASRLGWGAVYHIQPLNDDDKIAALQLHASERGLELSADAARFIIQRTARDPRYLFNTIKELDRASLAAERRLTIPFIKEVLNL